MNSEVSEEAKTTNKIEEDSLCFLSKWFANHRLHFRLGMGPPGQKIEKRVVEGRKNAACRITGEREANRSQRTPKACHTLFVMPDQL